MKLIGIYMSGDRYGEMYLTDLTVMEFSIHMKHSIGNHAIMHVSDVSPQEAQRWDALGLPTVYRRNLNR